MSYGFNRAQKVHELVGRPSYILFITLINVSIILWPFRYFGGISGNSGLSGKSRYRSWMCYMNNSKHSTETSNKLKITDLVTW